MFLICCTNDTKCLDDVLLTFIFPRYIQWEHFLLLLTGLWLPVSFGLGMNRVKRGDSQFPLTVPKILLFEKQHCPFPMLLDKGQSFKVERNNGILSRP